MGNLIWLKYPKKCDSKVAKPHGMNKERQLWKGFILVDKGSEKSWKSLE